jgi:TonB family protein
VPKGRVVARLRIDEKGNVTDIDIIASTPPRVFDRAVQDTLSEWKCVGEGSRYQASVEINFTLKDE